MIQPDNVLKSLDFILQQAGSMQPGHESIRAIGELVGVLQYQARTLPKEVYNSCVLFGSCVVAAMFDKEAYSELIEKAKSVYNQMIK